MVSNKILFIGAFAALIFFLAISSSTLSVFAADDGRIVIGGGAGDEKPPENASPKGADKAASPAEDRESGKIVIGASEGVKPDDAKKENNPVAGGPVSPATAEAEASRTCDVPMKEPAKASENSASAKAPSAEDVSGKETAGKTGAAEEKPAREESAKGASPEAEPEKEAEKTGTAQPVAKGSKASEIKALPPSGLNASLAGGRVRLVWAAAENAHHYNIYRDSTGVITKKSAKYNTNQNEFEDEDVREGETYYYFVTTAVKSAGGKSKYIESEPAGPLKVETVDKTPPGAVEALKIEHAENGKVRLSWTGPQTGPAAAHYIISRGESEAASALKEIKTQDVLSFEEEGLENEKQYYYSVAAVSKNGVKGPPAGPIPVKLKDTIAPAAPRGIAAAAHPGRIELSWERPADADTAYYTIYKSEDGGNEYKKIATPSLITDERYTDSAVKGGKEYFYRITASDKCANESKPCEPAINVKIKLPLNVSFSRTGEKSYCGFAYNPELRSLHMTESADGKTWSWWNQVIQNFPLPDDYSDDCRIAFARDGKKITAFVYDTEKMSISAAVSADDGRNWKWWEVYSSSLPLPDGFDENTRIDFSVRGGQVHCICFNPSAGTLSAASTSDGKSWKWWKKFGENLSALPNQTAGSLGSACFYGGQFEAFSYNPDDKTLYKGVLPAGKNNYASWNEVASKFPAPPR